MQSNITTEESVDSVESANESWTNGSWINGSWTNGSWTNGSWTNETQLDKWFVAPRNIKVLVLFAESCITSCNTANTTRRSKGGIDCTIVPTAPSASPGQQQQDVILPACLTVVFILGVAAIAVALVRRRRMALIQRARQREAEIKLQDKQLEMASSFSKRPLPRPNSRHSYLELMSAQSGNNTYTVMGGPGGSQPPPDGSHYLEPHQPGAEEPVYHEVHTYYDVSPYLKMDQFKQKQ